METKGCNELYEWEFINNSWKVTPNKIKINYKPRELKKLDNDGLKATSIGRVTADQEHYKDE